MALPNGVRLQAVDAELAQRLLLACKFRAEAWDPHRQFGVAQAFVRTVDPTDANQRHLYAWDQDKAIFTTPPAKRRGLASPTGQGVRSRIPLAPLPALLR